MRRHLTAGPCLILLMGVAGTGKSTLAHEIIRRVWAVYLDNNHIADAFFPHSRNGPGYRRLRPGFYRALYTVAGENLAAGNSVLLDMPHVKEVQSAPWRASIRTLVKRTDATLVVIRCFCSEDTLRDRIAARGEKRDSWKLKHWPEFIAEQPIRVRIPFPHLDVDTENSQSENLTAAVRYIREQAGPKRTGASTYI